MKSLSRSLLRDTRFIAICMHTRAIVPARVQTYTLACIYARIVINIEDFKVEVDEEEGFRKRGERVETRRS